MLTLMLLRHAKAEPAGRDGDADRALTDGGKRDAGRLGAFLRPKGLAPDFALVSAAKRAQQTFAAVVAGLGGDVPARDDPKLYSATPAQLRSALAEVDAGTRCVMIVGHNPAIAETASHLATTGDGEAVARLRERFPPCSLAVLRFDADDWRGANAGHLELFVTPDDLGR